MAPGMQLETRSYDLQAKKWSAPLPALDGERTLVLAFGASELIDDPEPIRELKRAYPRSHVVGCSSAGEIVGTTVRDHALSVAVARFEKTPLLTAMVEVADASESFAAGRIRQPRSTAAGVSCDPDRSGCRRAAPARPPGS